MMTHRNTKRKTTWTVHLVFPDAPHLRRLTEYHQYLNLLLPQQEPNYRRERDLPGHFYRSNRYVHAKYLKLYKALCSRCPSFEYVHMFPIYTLAPPTMKLDFSRPLSKDEFFPKTTNFVNSWCNDGIAPNALTLLPWKFTLKIMDMVTQVNRAPTVTKYYQEFQAYLDSFKDEVFKFCIPRIHHLNFIKMCDDFGMTLHILYNSPPALQQLDDIYSPNRRVSPFRCFGYYRFTTKQHQRNYVTFPDLPALNPSDFDNFQLVQIDIPDDWTVENSRPELQHVPPRQAPNPPSAHLRLPGADLIPPDDEYQEAAAAALQAQVSRPPPALPAAAVPQDISISNLNFFT